MTGVYRRRNYCSRIVHFLLVLTNIKFLGDCGGVGDGSKEFLERRQGSIRLLLLELGH